MLTSCHLRQALGTVRVGRRHLHRLCAVHRVLFHRLQAVDALIATGCACIFHVAGQKHGAVEAQRKQLRQRTEVDGIVLQGRLHQSGFVHHQP